MLREKALVLVLLLALMGCGVRVEIATPVAPTPTPRRFPLELASEEGAWREVARPQVLFQDGTPQLVPFLAPELPVYIVQDRLLWLTASYTATWLDGGPEVAASSAQLRLTLYRRAPDSTTWETYDSDGRGLNTSSVPQRVDEEITLSIAFDHPGRWDVRAELTVLAYPPSGDVVTRTDVLTLPVIVLSDPGEERDTSTDSLWPQVGDVREDLPLLDWRGWFRWPCEEGFSAMCEAADRGELEAAANALLYTRSLDESTRAEFLSQAGLLRAQAGDVEGAREAFRQAADSFVTLDRYVDVTTALHNLAAMQLAAGEEGAWTTVQQLSDLLNQVPDEAGRLLLDANLGWVLGESWRMDEARSYFAEDGLPQAAVLDAWIMQIDG